MTLSADGPEEAWNPVGNAVQLLDRPGVPLVVKPTHTMNRKQQETGDSWENDAVWKLLDQVPPATAARRWRAAVCG